ncbi:MAG: prepilin-type N-terminal cleavage/methylation domain-containing protein, partial [Actinobacteria bacterium]|nr:prepilin-type N-terminal cleavage/methylation domain-containing protein [Actinomycetota bacterium]
MSYTRSKNQTGFTLIEVIVSVAILVVLALGIFSLILLSLRITADNKYYVEAIEIANQKMEQIRNLPYSEVGVQGGMPGGSIPQVETISREGTFTVNTYVTYYDDPYDGSDGNDAVITDYKIATIKVSWIGKFGNKNVTIFSKIIPRTEETDEGYGLLKILVSDSNGSPLANANVRVVNNGLIPTVDVVNPTDSNGILYLPALESFQGYEITVTKTDEETSGIYYGTDQSYNISTGKSPVHLSVTEGDKTEEGFIIDKLANLRIRTVSNTLPDNWRVNQPQGTRDQINANFSIDGSDNMYFVWQSNTAASSYVYAQKYNASSVKQWTNDYKISNTTFQRNPDIVTASNGNSFIVWQDDSITLKQTAYNGSDDSGKKYAANIINGETPKNLKKSTFFSIKHQIYNIIKNITTYHYNTRIPNLQDANLRIANKFEEFK